MKTLGIDLAAEPKRTAACEIDWRAGSVRVDVGCDDSQLLAKIDDSDHVGIDAPFGWPRDFDRPGTRPEFAHPHARTAVACRRARRDRLVPSRTRTARRPSPTPALAGWATLASRTPAENPA